MNISKIQAKPTNLELTQTIADSYQMKVAGGAHSAVVEHTAAGYRAHLVPSVPGQSATGLSVTEAEANLSLLNLLA